VSRDRETATIALIIAVLVGVVVWSLLAHSNGHPCTPHSSQICVSR